MSTNFQDSRKKSWEAVLFQAAIDISIPPALYETINERYKNLENILNAADDPILHKAHIFSQGSIRLKTAIKPLSSVKKELGTVDADAVVWLENTSAATADEVLEAIQKRFEDGSKVSEPIKPLRRGVRMIYSDDNPGFHIDITPAKNTNWNDKDCGKGDLLVPDRETGWKASSPIEYSDWLQTVSEKTLPVVAMDHFRESAELVIKATREDMPDYQQYADFNVLRALIKLIKRNRDVWAAKNPRKNDYRPTSAVLTTLAARAYEKLANQNTAISIDSPFDVMHEIIKTMPDFILGDPGNWLVCNPVNQEENFAEKWNRTDGNEYREAFYEWHQGALQAISLGLSEYASNVSFQDAMIESFDVNRSTIENATRELPPSWNLPGRELGITGAQISLGILSGPAVASNKPQEVRSLDRLG